MRLIGTALQLLLLALFVVAYIAAIIPAALIVALHSPKIVAAKSRRVKTTIGLGHNVRRIY
jgi:hypothetical protein